MDSLIRNVVSGATTEKISFIKRPDFEGHGNMKHVQGSNKSEKAVRQKGNDANLYGDLAYSHLHLWAPRFK